IKAKDGQKARILDIPIEGYKHGIHDTLHGHTSGRSLSDALIAATNKDYGVAGKAMVAHLLSNIDRVMAQARAEMATFEALVEARPPDAHGGIHGRVRQRFALIAAGGEIATAAGLTGWATGTAQAAAYAVYERWLNAQARFNEEGERFHLIHWHSRSCNRCPTRNGGLSNGPDGLKQVHKHSFVHTGPIVSEKSVKMPSACIFLA
ncbi:MAG: hypothetical protein K9G72_21340, partial [Rhodobacteraceae bacterium]|nr:hypothetical protein [Paracoccaceae bacterium]